MASDLPVWAGSGDADALTRLLALRSERDWLDYKRQCDLSSARGAVEFAKDAGAMMLAGGYILVGADDQGQPAGDVEHLGLFDPATLHAKLARYLPEPFEIRATTHQYQGQSYALLYVVPHPDGFAIFERDGTYQDGKSHVTAFRAGEVFARHGTRSERWDQRDVAVIKHRLRAAADRGRDQETEALELLQSVPDQLGGSGLWLAVAAVPEYPMTDAPMISPDAAQQFLRDWQLAQAPIEGFAQGTATYRQPGGVVITNQAAIADRPHWWRLALSDAGRAVGAYVLAHRVAANPLTDGTQWYGLPEIVSDGQTIPVRRDEVEIRLLTLVDILSAHPAALGAGGSMVITATLLAPQNDAWTRVALLNEQIDDGGGQRLGWHLAGTRAQQPFGNAVGVPVPQRARLADLRDPVIRLQTTYRLAADLLAIFGIDSPSMLRDDGTLHPGGTATDRQQIVYQHARHLGLPVDDVSPANSGNDMKMLYGRRETSCGKAGRKVRGNRHDFAVQAQGVARPLCRSGRKRTHYSIVTGLTRSPAAIECSCGSVRHTIEDPGPAARG